MNHPKISIIIPVYNVEKYLRECLDSVVNQTFSDLEIICVDDGSTDSSGAILEEYAAKDSRFVVLHQSNAGQSTARNKGLDIVSGEYILFVDSDDKIALDTIEKTYEAARISASELVLFYMYLDNSVSKSIQAPCSIDEPVKDLLSKTKLAFFQGPGPCKWLWKKSFLDKLRLRFIEGIKFEDVPFVLDAALHSNSISVIPGMLYYYRIHDGTTTRMKNDYFCRFSWLAYQYALESVQDLNLSDECLQIIYQQKLALIWNGYCNWTPDELLGQFRKNIKNSVLPHELEWIKNNKLGLTNKQRMFFLGIYGNWFSRLQISLKIAKESFADWLAKKLVPHSPWLQNLCQIIDERNKDL